MYTMTETWKKRTLNVHIELYMKRRVLYVHKTCTWKNVYSICTHYTMAGTRNNVYRLCTQWPVPEKPSTPPAMIQPKNARSRW